MKIKTYKPLVLFLVFALSFTGCGKYEEGPSFSLRSRTNRVVNTWAIDRVFIEDKDASTLMQGFINSYRIEFTKDDRVIEKYTSDIGTHTNLGTWRFEDSYARILINYSGRVKSYKILRLASDEMWLEEMDNDIKFEWRLKEAD